MECICCSTLLAVYLNTLVTEAQFICTLVAWAVNLALCLKILYYESDSIVNRRIGKYLVVVHILGLNVRKLLCLELSKKSLKFNSSSLKLLCNSVLVADEGNIHSGIRAIEKELISVEEYALRYHEAMILLAEDAGHGKPNLSVSCV